MVSPVSFLDRMVHRAVLLLTSFPSATKPPPYSSENWAKLILSPLLTKTLLHWSAVVAQAPVKSKAPACELSTRPQQNRRTYSPVDRLTLNIARLPQQNAKCSYVPFARNSVSHRGFWRKEPPRDLCVAEAPRT